MVVVSDRAPDRSASPLIRIGGLASLDFEKPELDAAQRFGIDFGLVIEDRSAESLVLRGADAGPALITIRRGEEARFVGPTFFVHDMGDLNILAAAWETPIVDHLGGKMVETIDPSGLPVRVVHGVTELPPLPSPKPQPLNMVDDPQRTNQPVRPELRPAPVQRLGHISLQTPHFSAAVTWYMETFGLIVSDYVFIESMADAHGPCIAYLRCDNGTDPTPHHVLALTLAPTLAFLHAGFAVADLDAMAMGGRHLQDQGHQHGWGIGRHIRGSHLFDYWHDADGEIFQHHTDGDLLTAKTAATWTALSADRNTSWGPPPTKDIANSGTGVRALRGTVGGLLDRTNEVTPRYLREVARITKAVS